jgi:hypothetical protein
MSWIRDAIRDFPPTVESLISELERKWSDTPGTPKFITASRDFLDRWRLGPMPDLTLESARSSFLGECTLEFLINNLTPYARELQRHLGDNPDTPSKAHEVLARFSPQNVPWLEVVLGFDVEAPIWSYDPFEIHPIVRPQFNIIENFKQMSVTAQRKQLEAESARLDKEIQAKEAKVTFWQEEAKSFLDFLIQKQFERISTYLTTEQQSTYRNKMIELLLEENNEDLIYPNRLQKRVWEEVRNIRI